jgi:hypothetical protein
MQRKMPQWPLYLHFPQRIRFEAKEGEQIIYKIGEEGSALFVRFTVKQLKDD